MAGEVFWPFRLSHVLHGKPLPNPGKGDLHRKVAPVEKFYHGEIVVTTQQTNTRTYAHTD